MKKLKKEHYRRITVTVLLFLVIGVAFSLGNGKKTKNKTIKVLSYNIHYGVGMDAKKDLPRIAAVINRLNPNIVGLQEVHDSTMISELSPLTNMNGVFGPSIEIEPPNLYKLLDIPVPESRLFYGDGILSKHPFKYIGNTSIPSATSSRYEAMCVDVDLSQIYGKNTFVRFINTHFDYTKTIGSKVARKGTVEVIERAFLNDSVNFPAILTGDFNSIPKSEPLKLLQEKGWVIKDFDKNLLTAPSTFPEKQIDYIMPRPTRNWKIINIEVINEPIASDHLPILMTLELIVDNN